MRLSFKTFFETYSLKTRLCVYDIDKTMLLSPEKSSDWTGKDWWGHPDSLSPPHYHGEVNQEVVNAFKRDKATPNTDVIVLTGRRGVIAHKVRQVLRSQDLHGKRVIPDSNINAKRQHQAELESGMDVNSGEEHEEYYCGDHVTEPDYPKTDKGKTDGSTLAHKIYVIQNKMSPNIETLELWDDREDHAPHFIKLGQDLLQKYGDTLKTVIFHRVFVSSEGECTVKHIKL